MLELIILESSDRSEELTSGSARDLIYTGFPDTGSIIPVVPTNLGSSFKVITYATNLIKVLKQSDKLGLDYNKVYPAAQSKLLKLCTAGSWIEILRCLNEDQAAWWLRWGVNWLVIDKTMFNKIVENDIILKNRYESVVQEELYRINSNRNYVFNNRGFIC